MGKIIVKLYGVESRRDYINYLACKLSIPDGNIFIDDRPNGGDALYTAKKAYLSDHGDATHGIFLQDDVEVCDNFLDICSTIVETHSDKIVSLFPFQFQHENEKLNTVITPYIATFGLSACGIIMPVKYIKPCFDYIKVMFDDNIADDKGIIEWAYHNKIDVITTIPAILQHMGDISALDPKRPIRRTVYFQENPIADWTNKEINTSFRKYIDFSPIGPNVIKI